MANIFVYNNDTNRMEYYQLSENASMPYNTRGTLLVREFRGSSRSSTLWTTKRAMQSFNRFSQIWGQPIYVGYAFKRIWEGGHAAMSQHYAGVSFDVGQNLDYNTRNNMRNLAIQSGIWTYVEPAYLTPTWVHFDDRQNPPACAAGGYPLVAIGSVGVYVLVLQDALGALGYTDTDLDGYFGPKTQLAVQKYQNASGLVADGIVGCQTWESITSSAVGIGQTATVASP